MTTELAIAALIIATACTTPDLLASTTAAPRDIRAACTLASRRCTQCHALDPILAQEPASPAAWRPIVHRMRFMPGSMIAPYEETPIVRCLVYRSFGEPAARTVSR